MNKPTADKYVTCPTCAGSGIAMYPCEDFLYSKPCHTCNGTLAVPCKPHDIVRALCTASDLPSAQEIAIESLERLEKVHGATVKFVVITFDGYLTGLCTSPMTSKLRADIIEAALKGVTPC